MHGDELERENLYSMQKGMSAKFKSMSAGNAGIITILLCYADEGGQLVIQLGS